MSGLAHNLTHKQETYALKRFEGLNESDAYRFAYAAENMKPATIWRSAHAVETNPKVSARIAELHAATVERSQVTVDRIVAELASIAFADIRDVVTWDEDNAYLIPAAELTRAQAGVIREMKQRRVVTRGQSNSGGEYEQTTDQREVKLHDKQRALEMLGKYLGMFRDEAPPDGDKHLHLHFENLTVDELRQLARESQ
ncbi:MAG: terminase small subunit [Acidobacteria bacterium]|nr:terminase small subunit [Acidobacteriota bacterium]